MNVLILTFLIVLIDQVTKLYVKGIKIPLLGIEFQGMPYQSSIPVFGNFFKITFIENPGMAFGLQIGGKLFLSLFTIFATLLLIFFLYKNRHEGLLLRLSLALILGGAIGNLIDRVFYGKIYDYAPYFYGRVVDFLHFDFPNFTIFGKTIYSWPIFNVADISVTFGFLLILFGYKKIFAEEEQPGSENESEMALEGNPEFAGLGASDVIGAETKPERGIASTEANQIDIEVEPIKSEDSKEVNIELHSSDAEDTKEKAGQNIRPAEEKNESV